MKALVREAINNPSEKTRQLIMELEEIIAQGCGLSKESIFTSTPKKKEER